MEPALPSRTLLRDGDIVFLIHGTFAAHTDWIEPNSAVANSIRACADVTIIPFRWSGLNSHRARLSAGAELGNSASKLAKSDPSAGLHFIGHSHGGNVALYALRDKQVFDRVKSLVFLGTPFLQIREHRLDDRVSFLCLVIAWSFYLLVLVGLLWFCELLPDILGVAVVLVGLSAMILLPSMVMRYWQPVYYALVRRVTIKFKVLQRRSRKWLWQAIPSQPVYIATVPADEARLWLTTIDWISLVPWQTWGLIYKSLIGVVIGFLIYGGYAQGIRAGGEHKGWEHDGWVNFLSAIEVLLFASITLPSLALFSSMLFRGNRYAFGWEGLWSHALLGLKPSRLPSWHLTPSSKIYTVRRSGTKGSSLRHSAFYQSDEVILDFTQWLRAASERQVSGEPAPLVRPRRSWIIPWLAGVATIITCYLFDRH
jgi:hypothetical protein